MSNKVGMTVLVAVTGLVLTAGVAVSQETGSPNYSCKTTPCYATEGDDIIRNWDTFHADQTIYALGGNDTVDGGDYDDTVYGGEGQDNLSGLYGDDTLYGGAGVDGITGGNGIDYLYGNAGDDYIDAQHDDYARVVREGEPIDTVYGGSGGDTIYAYGDNRQDKINCGKGTDKVYYEKGIDTVNKNCEKRYPDQRGW